MKLEEIERRLEALRTMRDLVREGDPDLAGNLEELIFGMDAYFVFVRLMEGYSAPMHEDLDAFEEGVRDAATPEMERVLAEARRVLDDMDAVAMKALGIGKSRRT